MTVRGLSSIKPAFEKEPTYESNNMIDKHQHEAHKGEIKHESLICVIRLYTKLVVKGHGGHCHQVCQDNAAENDENILWDKAPRRMAGSKECRLGMPVSIRLAGRTFDQLTWSCMTLGPGRPPTAESRGVESMSAAEAMRLGTMALELAARDGLLKLKMPITRYSEDQGETRTAKEAA
jgi:hypothetical protein